MTDLNLNDVGEWVAFDAPTPRYAAGTFRYANRTVTVTVRPTEQQLYALTSKIGKLNRHGGTIRVTPPGGSTASFDVVAAGALLVNLDEGTATAKFLCKPFARLDGTDH